MPDSNDFVNEHKLRKPGATERTKLKEISTVRALVDRGANEKKLKANEMKRNKEHPLPPPHPLAPPCTRRKPCPDVRVLLNHQVASAEGLGKTEKTLPAKLWVNILENLQACSVKIHRQGYTKLSYWYSATSKTNWQKQHTKITKQSHRKSYRKKATDKGKATGKPTDKIIGNMLLLHILPCQTLLAKTLGRTHRDFRVRAFFAGNKIRLKIQQVLESIGLRLEGVVLPVG